MGFLVYLALKMGDVRALLFAVGGVGAGVVAVWLIATWVLYSSKKESIKWEFDYDIPRYIKSHARKLSADATKRLKALLPEAKERTKKILWLLPWVLGVFLLAALLPSTEEVAMIYVIPKVARNEDMRKIPGNVAALANEGLEKLIEAVRDKERGK